MAKMSYESPIVSIIILTVEGALCGSPEQGQSESIKYENLFDE